MSKRKPIKQPLNVMSDDALGVGFKKLEPAQVHILQRKQEHIKGFSYKNDVNRTVRNALEAIYITQKGVRAVLVMAIEKDGESTVTLFSSSEKDGEKILSGALVGITEQVEFGDEETLSFDIEPLIGLPKIDGDGKLMIKSDITKKRETANAMEVVVIYKDAITVCGNIPRYIHYDFV